MSHCCLKQLRSFVSTAKLTLDLRNCVTLATSPNYLPPQFWCVQSGHTRCCPRELSQRGLGGLNESVAVGELCELDRRGQAQEGCCLTHGPGMALVYLLRCRAVQAWLTDVFPLAGGPTPGGGAPWHLRNVLSDSVESSDDEFFDARGE